MPPKKLKLESSDGDILEVEADIIRQSQTIDNMMSDLPADSQQEDDVIPLPNVNGNILQKVIDWCRHHRNEEPYQESDETVKRSDDIPQWDQEFLKVDQGTLFELIMAANYLDIKKLLDLCCKNVANMIKGKTAEEIRKTFNIKNDFTDEEQAQVTRENQWCDESAT